MNMTRSQIAKNSNELAAKLKRGEQINWTFTPPEVKEQLFIWFGGQKNFGWSIGEMIKAKLLNPDQKINIF